ncbi:hypothetical protein P0D69_46250, partial [Paraburkholderia sediminicola]|uniref:hypothetical protein n=1 Tax=Paraburkholderia sediminicola TaxID=458836 RepID=UPI0038B8E57B
YATSSFRRLNTMVFCLRLRLGYCAFALPAKAVCEKLGAANENPKQLILGFELGRRRILQAVEHKGLSRTGERITLSAGDLV